MKRYLHAKWMGQAVALALALQPGWVQADNQVAMTSPLRMAPQMIKPVSLSANEAPRLQPGEETYFQDMFKNNPQHLDDAPGGCARSRAALCYDYRTGSAVYKPMRNLLPEIPGLTPQNLSIRRDKIVARYTFK